MEERTVLQAKRLGIVSCRDKDLLGHIVVRMADNDISALVVVDEQGDLAGIITRSDLLRARAETLDWPEARVEEFMTSSVVAVPPETPLSHVVELMLGRHIHRVVVVRKEEGRSRPIAVISDSDLVCEMANELMLRSEAG